MIKTSPATVTGLKTLSRVLDVANAACETYSKLAVQLFHLIGLGDVYKCKYGTIIYFDLFFQSWMTQLHLNLKAVKAEDNGGQVSSL